MLLVHKHVHPCEPRNWRWLVLETSKIRYLPSLSINYVSISKDMGKRLPQLYYIKMKISYDVSFIAIRVDMAM